MNETTGDIQRPATINWRAAAWGGAALLLAASVALQFSGRSDWTPSDFAVLGGMLLSACAAFELLLRASGGFAYRAGAAVAVGGAFILVWVQLAVGVIGDGEAPANLAPAGVLVLLTAGAVVARLRAKGLALTLLLATIAQLGIVIFAAATGHGTGALPAALWAGVWLLAAGLFHRAASQS